MNSVPARKKSIISTSSLHIDTPVANNTLLNKAASQSTSLYQQCSSLRTRLMRIRGFPYYFTLASSSDSRQSTDPVTQLWDLFSLGIPLCYIFDQLPAEAGFSKINNSEFNQEKYEANPDRAKKHAIALFAMQIRTDKVVQNIPGCELFTVTDLWDRNSTDGLVKVINTVTALVNHLPPTAFEEAPPSPPLLSANDSFDSLADSLPTPPTNAQEAARNNIVREMVETERKYVQDLEIMQKYSNALSQGNLIDQDTIHLLFPNLNKLLNFQRKFLIRLESTAELPWPEQRWGQHFLESEDEFVVYEPYCANYTNATELMLTNEESLVPLNHLINVKGELPAFLIKPIQRICKYPLLLDSLIKACSPATYPHYDELKHGSDAAKRITDKINEAQRRAENEQTVKSLHSRIEDWKGHHLENFGELLLDDIFVVTKSEVDREYHVFLFEKIILCCKEAVPQPVNGSKKVSKSNSILKKQPIPPPLTLPGGVGQPTRKNTPLLLKGRIFLGNVTKAVPVAARNSTASGIPTQYPLSVYWKGDDDIEFFTLRCRREDQMRQWEAQINRLIRESAQRRASERSGMSISRILANNSTNPAPHARIGAQSHNSYSAPVSMYSNPSSSRNIRSTNPYHTDVPSGGPYGGGPQGYPPHDGFEFEPDDEDFEDYPPAASSNYQPTGRGTPMGRRNNNAFSVASERERDSMAAYDRPRAQTESNDSAVMAQWRNNNVLPPPIPSGSAVSPGSSMMGRPITPRLQSNMSATSVQSDASFGNGAPRSGQRPQLRSQFSSTRLKSGYDVGDYRSGRSTPTLPTNVNALGNANLAAPPSNRSRSISQPQAYVPKSVPPPLPTTGVNQSHWSRSNTTMASSNKRGSGSSESTENSSDYSPNSSSPITPFGSSESSLANLSTPPVKVKVHFHEDIFVIQVARSTEYDDLVEKVGRKIRLCGPRRDDGPLRVKYRDEDGDLVSLGSTEDVQMAFEQWRPGGQVTLFVT
ncbi:hypothetical protein BDQ12DRAFT_660997 [Crucibulum laeve]|uniref:Rho guanine nucleotide exchange factor scd1 n=1 Tax=Crucibulum laeve TaxID=68775 RepID=A0A5C3MHQ8_9AGAR|nr:hypothetical protein BDQ12DRAFT_660997 [Crucibulum laeve]